MRPAFSSTKQATAFFLMLLILLAAPWLASLGVPPQPELTSSNESYRWERYPWVQDLIYEEKGDIDIAFVGSSHLLYGIDTPFVQNALDEKMGYPTTVRSICWKGSGFDSLFFFTKDLLAHRKVKTLVIYDETAGDARNSFEEVQIYTPTWFRYQTHGSLTRSLPIKEQCVYYFASVLGTPRNLLESVIPNLPVNPDTTPDNFIHWEPYNSENLGCVRQELAFDPKLGPRKGSFVSHVPEGEVSPDEAILYGPDTRAEFTFLRSDLPVIQSEFARRFARLANENGCHVVVLNVPMYPDRRSETIVETYNWTDLMGPDLPILGIAPEKVFRGLTDPEVAQLYFDPAHLNQNGQQFFTPLITPALLSLHEKKTHH